MIDDLVQGTVRVNNAEMDDLVILRSDGTPTYNHSVVVDDHDMGITHVIRGDDHLTNAFHDQSQIYAAMGWEPPRFGHLPLIHGPDGAKLSKRHGAQFALEFRELGYLPEALCNYLLRLGWAHGDVEVLDRAEAIRLFDMDGVGRAPSRMDYAKLNYLNGVYIRQADDERLTTETVERLARRPGLMLDDQAVVRIRRLTPALKERGEDAGRTGGFCRLPGAPRAAADGAESRRIAHPGRTAVAAQPRGRAGSEPVHAGSAGRDTARLRGANRTEARPGGAAVAGGADRQHGQPGDRPHARGAGSRGNADPHCSGCKLNSSRLDPDQCRRLRFGAFFASRSRRAWPVALLSWTPPQTWRRLNGAAFFL